MRKILFLTIENNAIVAKDYPDTGRAVQIETREQLFALAAERGLDVVASSSIDFPEESTSDESVIALARMLRGPAHSTMAISEAKRASESRVKTDLESVRLSSGKSLPASEVVASGGRK